MFTGLIDSIGMIDSFKDEGKGIKLVIKVWKDFLSDVDTGDSISVDGICLTVTDVDIEKFTVFAMKETVDRTTLKAKSGLKNRMVNLEKSLKLGGRLDGHLVYGHVDFTSRVINVTNEGVSKIYKFVLPSEYRKYIVEKGSVAINGVSLTVKNREMSSFCVALIPETQERTNLSKLRASDIVNVELDIIGKYVENFIKR